MKRHWFRIHSSDPGCCVVVTHCHLIGHLHSYQLVRLPPALLSWCRIVDGNSGVKWRFADEPVWSPPKEVWMPAWATQTLRGKCILVQPNTECEIWATNKITLEEGRGLEQASTYVFLPATGEAQRCDSEHIDNGNGNDIHIVIELHIVIAILCLCCDFNTLLYHAA